jgi:predicted RNA binding protein with dsRBD fold (UPF0201 family)
LFDERRVKYHLQYRWPMLEIRMRTRCYPTEDKQLVIRAMTSLFPGAEVNGTEELEARSASAAAFSEQLKRQRIRDSARAVLRRGIRDNTTTFRLNKQVATIGKVSFSEEEHPLGDVLVEISADDIYAFIDDVAPNTKGVAAR